MRTKHQYRIGEVAELLGVSPDTVRRWADGRRLRTRRTRGGQRVVDGAAIADFLRRAATGRGPAIRAEPDGGDRRRSEAARTGPAA